MLAALAEWASSMTAQTAVSVEKSFQVVRFIRLTVSRVAKKSYTQIKLQSEKTLDGSPSLVTRPPRASA
jgi:hypothetical protein